MVVLDQVKRGLWDVVVLSPPCGTWSRARYQWKLHPGPKPLRSSSWPLGFPWLSDQCRRQVEVANYFVFQSILAAELVAQSGGFYLFEHPEDLGEVAGEVPASIWQLPEMRQLVEKVRLGQFISANTVHCLRSRHVLHPTSVNARIFSALHGQNLIQSIDTWDLFRGVVDIVIM